MRDRCGGPLTERHVSSRMSGLTCQYEVSPTAAAAVSNQLSGVPMPGIDKATGRVIILVALVIVAALALRGYLPGDENTPREESTGRSGSFYAVVALLSASMVIIAIAMITRLRGRRTAWATGAGSARSYLRRRGRPAWRFLMIGLGVIAVWLLIVALLTWLSAVMGIDQPPSATESSTV